MKKPGRPVTYPCGRIRIWISPSERHLASKLTEVCDLIDDWRERCYLSESSPRYEQMKLFLEEWDSLFKEPGEK